MLKFRGNFLVILIRRYCSNGVKTDAENVRVRFAPSPTGYLHLGGLRTIAFNYLFARSKRGSFILRVEDTDRRRIVEDSLPNLLSMLKWLNLPPDEGPGSLGGDFGPYLQSQRLELYKKEAEKLVESQKAYYCFCSEDRLMMLRNEALKNRQIVRYDGKCRHLKSEEVERKLKSGQQYVLRFKMEPKITSFTDLVYGEYEFNPESGDSDFVMIKSDGFPTYHFANVVDDHYMQISHVLRGEEWLAATPKHHSLYDAFGWTPPSFGHLPLMMGLKGEKLSKRNDAAFVEYYKDLGYYPLALINSVCSTGKGFKDKKKDYLYELDELAEKFDVTLIGRKHTRFEPDWLDFYNKEVMRRFQDVKPMVEQVRELIKRKYAEKFYNDTSKGQEKIDLEELPDFLNIFDETYIEKCIIYAKNRISTLNQLFEEDLASLWSIPDSSLDTFTRVGGSNLDEAVEILRLVRNHFQNAKDDDSSSSLNQNFSVSNISTHLRTLCEKSGAKFPRFMQILRAAVCGCTVGLPMGELFELLGRENVVKRLTYVLDHVKIDEKRKNAENSRENDDKMSESV